LARIPVIKVNSDATNRNCTIVYERAPYPEEDSPPENEIDRGTIQT
jgi:hypothetical protein